jgi:hypothetical protein
MEFGLSDDNPKTQENTVKHGVFFIPAALATIGNNRRFRGSPGIAIPDQEQRNLGTIACLLFLACGKVRPTELS